MRKEKQEKKGPFVPVGNTYRDKRVRQPRGAGSTFYPDCQTRDKRIPFCPGLVKVFQPKQINVFIIVPAAGCPSPT